MFSSSSGKRKVKGSSAWGGFLTATVITAGPTWSTMRVTTFSSGPMAVFSEL